MYILLPEDKSDYCIYYCVGFIIVISLGYFIFPYALSGAPGWLEVINIYMSILGIFFNMGIIMALYFIIRGISNKKGGGIKKIMKDVEELRQLDPKTIIREDSHSLLKE